MLSVRIQGTRTITETFDRWIEFDALDDIDDEIRKSLEDHAFVPMETVIVTETKVVQVADAFGPCRHAFEPYVTTCRL